MTKYQLLMTFFLLMQSAGYSYSQNVAGMNKDFIEICYSINKEARTASVIENHYTKYKGNITIPAKIEWEGADYKVASIAENAFRQCKELTGITLPNSLIDIEPGAFFDCSAIKRLVIPTSVVHIYSNAFNNCTGLKELIIEDSPEPLLNAQENFLDSSIDSFYWGRDMDSSPFRFVSFGVTDSTCLKKVVFGDRVTKIPFNAFSSCRRLETVVLSKSIKRIGKNAFRGCRNLRNLILPNSLDSIEERAFEHCVQLTEIVIPRSVTFIQYSAFSDCPNLKKVIIEDGDKLIKDFCRFSEARSMYLGRNCLRGSIFDNNLEELIIGNKVTSIEWESGCRNLTKLVLPDSVRTIGNYAFADCWKLTELTIPRSVVSIGDRAFANMTLVIETGRNMFPASCLKVINCKNPVPPEIGKYNFGTLDKEKCTLFVPLGSSKKYRQHPVWGLFLKIEEKEW